jgi:gentisate 1,2-dioxygenase
MSNIFHTDYKATTPNLLSGFIKLDNQQQIVIDVMNKSEFNASSHLFYIIEGDINIILDDIHVFTGSPGDIIISPKINKLEIIANSSASIYYVNDSPLLNYIGVIPNKDKFTACCYSRDFIFEKLELLSDVNNNRKGILLGNQDTEKIGTKTITHILWTLFNEVPEKTNQKVHKHNSVAIDYCVFSPDETKVYTLVGDKLDENGNIINPQKIYWKTGTMFITPPGLWHSHHNETNNSAYVLPIQDAGLLIYQRILGIILH